MNPPPLVSIIIPCFNAERTVADAVESCLRQTHEQVEVLVVDDGSKDQSRTIVERLAARARGRLRLLTGPHRGAGAARNRGLDAARGEFIQFNDADDLLHPEKVAACLAATDDELDFAYSDLDWFEDRQIRTRAGRLSLRVWDQLKARNKRSLEPTWSRDQILPYLVHPGIHTPLPLHRRSLLVELGGFDESLSCAQEYDLHLRMALHLRARRGASAGLRTRFIDRKLVFVRGHDGPRIGSHPDTPVARLRVVLSLFDRLSREAPFDAALRTAFAIRLCQHARAAYRTGERDLTLRAFALADELDPKRPTGLGRAYDELAHRFGILRVEQVFVGMKRFVARRR